MDPFKIVWEDQYLMVIDKQAGVVVDPSQTQQTGTLAQTLMEEYGIALERGGIVHRLDKDTSGLLVVAKTQEALEGLQAQFKGRTVKKTYIALCHGQLKSEVRVEGAIGRNPKDRERFTVLEGGKEAVTIFVPLKHLVMDVDTLERIFEGFNKIQFRKLQNLNYGQFTLILAHPETGRTHQIRVHLKHTNHPLVSDARYGGRKTVRQDKRWCPRQFLHATRIEFDHPVSNERMSFDSKLPVDLNDALGNLEESKNE